MRPGLSAIAEANSLTIQWVFEVDSNYWTSGNPVTYDSNKYSSKVITDSFVGILEKNTRYADRLIPPNTTSFSITGDKADFNPSDFKGEDVLITLLDEGVKVYAWRFYVKSCYYAYGKFNFTCEDFLQKYLFQNYYPNEDLLNSYNDTTAVMNGPSNAVVPQVFGTAYPQLRIIPDANEWYTVLGEIAGVYTVDEVQTPVEFADKKSVYETPTYTFTQSNVSGFRVFANDIGKNGDNAPFGWSGKLYDLPTQFSNSLTVSTTDFPDVISNILQALGVPASQIDTAGTFATAKTKLSALGLTCNYCFTTKEDAVKVLCELLESCNCIMPRSDVVQLIYLEDGAAVKTIDRDEVLNLKFSEKKYTEYFDAGYATYFTEVQAGEPSEIEVPIDGVSYTNISAERVLYRYTYDTQIIQKLSIIYYRRKFLQTGTVSFGSNHSMLEPYLGDRLDISDSLYEDYDNVYVDQITIKPDLKFEFSLDSYSETIGDLSDYSPSAVVKTVDTSQVISPERKITSGGPVNVEAGGDIIMKSDGTNRSRLIFTEDGGTDETASMFTPESVYDVLAIDPSSTAFAGKLEAGRDELWANVIFRSSTSSIFYAGVDAANNAYLSCQNILIQAEAVLFASNGLNLDAEIVAHSSTGNEHVQLSVGNYRKKMVYNYTIVENPLVMTYTSATLDSNIGTAIGDNITFHHTTGAPAMRYRNSGGTITGILL